MKNIIISALLIISFSACKKDKNTTSNNNSGANNTTNAYVKFKANGVAYQFDAGLTNIYTDTKQGGFTFNNGNSANLLSFTSSLNNMELVTKTYTFSNNGFNGMTLVIDRSNSNTGAYKMYNSTGPQGEGAFTVTKIKTTTDITNAINGTFTAKLYNKNGDVLNVTEGEFFSPLTN